jgi:hypothetical protein
MQRVLILYPNTLLPVDSGSKKLTFQLIKYLKKKGKFLDIFSLYYEKKNNGDLSKYCNNLFEIQNPLFNNFLKIINKVFNIFVINPLKKDLTLKFFLKKQISNILQDNNYDLIILNYVQWNDLIPKKYKSKTMILTHDIFYYRYQSFSKYFHQKYLYQLIKHYEIKVLNEFNKILVVADYEKNELSKFIDIKKIKYIGAPQTIKKINHLNYKYTFGFIGANTWQNEEAIEYYINKYFYVFKNELLIAGTICENKKVIKMVNKNSKIKLMGFVNNKADFYESCKFIVAPILSGSGIKIKVLEALSYGKVVLVTNKSIEGINVKHMKEVINIDLTPKKELKNILLNFDRENYINISSMAVEYIRKNFSEEKLFKNILE